MSNGAQNFGPSSGYEPASAVSQAASGTEALRQRIAKIHEAQKHLLSALQNNLLPLSQVAADLARLETDLAEAQRSLNQATGAPA